MNSDHKPSKLGQSDLVYLVYRSYQSQKMVIYSYHTVLPAELRSRWVACAVYCLSFCLSVCLMSHVARVK